MNNNQLRYFALIVAEQARIEGMKAENALYASRGDYPPYHEQDFLTSAGVLDQIAVEIINSHGN